MEDSTRFGLNSRVIIEELADNRIAIVKKIKSRIIRKDAEKIIEQAKQINKFEPEKSVVLVCHDNICSKSVKLLNDNNIEIIRE